VEIKTYKCYSGDVLMPWGKGTVVKGARGFVFAGGITAWVDGYDPKSPGYASSKTVVEGAEAQTRLALEKLKANLEEMGTSLDNIVKLTYYIKGPFPEGVNVSPNWRPDIISRFFEEHCPRLYESPPPSELIGVMGLAHPDMVIEIVCIAALPD
jgi:enamine deaminase RidA (YjgF/YER057c/UK114 family)